MITSAQSRAARGLVDFTLEKLAGAAKLDLETVRRFEAGTADAAAAEAIQHALESAGVEFIADEGDGAGVRLAKPKPEPILNEDLNASNDE